MPYASESASVILTTFDTFLQRHNLVDIKPAAITNLYKAFAGGFYTGCDFAHAQQERKEEAEFDKCLQHSINCANVTGDLYTALVHGFYCGCDYTHDQRDRYGS